MRSTLKGLAVECIEIGRNGSPDPLKYPSQILCLAEAVLFTERCAEAIRRGRLSEFLKDLQVYLLIMTNRKEEFKTCMSSDE